MSNHSCETLAILAIPAGVSFQVAFARVHSWVDWVGSETLVRDQIFHKLTTRV
ncbi:hypothetical protein [Dapis sp. BLCC M229]|uniref:hypothetical protein n=1 Tax=Dapis sp. BLCC M229 TaxID=3400188 RepID=UPI003CF02D5F